MKRPTRSAGKTAKKPRRKRAAVRRLSRTHLANSRDLQVRVDALERELTEAREQQTATSEVLKVISSSPSELTQVFQAMLESATRICEAGFANLNLCEGDGLRIGAMYGAPPEWIEYRRQIPVLRPGPNTGLGRAMRTKRTIQIDDVLSDAAFAESDPLRLAFAKIVGARTFLCVPMLKAGDLIGIIGIYRLEVRPFTEKQIGCRTSPHRPSSPSRMPVCSTSCASR